MSNRLKIEDKLDTMNENLHKISLAIGGEVQKPSTWEEIRILCRNNNIRGLLEVGETVEFTRDGVKYNAVVMDFIEDGQHSSGLKLRDGLQTGVIFQTEKILYNMQFDSQEAFHGVEGSAMPAGTYTFNIPTSYSNWSAGNYTFTTTKETPVGGRLVFSGQASTALTSLKVNTYSSPTSSILESVSISSGNSGTSLGVMDGTVLNHPQRASYGSNRYATSAIRQHLNSDGEAGAVWTPQTKFDMPPSWLSSSKGFLNGLQKDLVDNIAKVDRHIYRNTVCDNGGYDEITETIFLPSRKECFFPIEGADDTEPFAFYRDNSISTVAHNNADACRIKNNMSGSSYYWWQESPGVGGAGGVRGVTTAGAYDYYGAYISGGVVPAFVIA